MTVKDIFENVNNWLKFAEAKNGAILVFNSALIAVLFNILEEYNNNDFFIMLYLYEAIFFLSLAIVIALLSFVPMLEYPYISFEEPKENDNLLYFGHIAKYHQHNDRYKSKVKGLLEESDSNSSFDDYYLEQIITNSKITYVKYKQFEFSIWFTLAAILTLPGAFILYKAWKAR